jgi:hypothetical protein
MLPNPWGIHNRVGEVISSNYLKRYAQCASRGMTFNREANINHFMDPIWLADHSNITTGEYCTLVKTDPCWIDPENPTAVIVKPPKPPKTQKPPKTPKPVADVAAAAAAEQAILAAETPVEAPAF